MARGCFSTICFNIKISHKCFIVLLQQQKGHEVLLINAFPRHFGGAWLCLVLCFTTRPVLMSTATQSPLSHCVITAMSVTLLLKIVISIFDLPLTTKSFLELKRSDFSLQLWEISWIQARGRRFLKDMQQFSTYCPLPAAPDLR